MAVHLVIGNILFVFRFTYCFASVKGSNLFLRYVSESDKGFGNRSRFGNASAEVQAPTGESEKFQRSGRDGGGFERRRTRSSTTDESDRPREGMRYGSVIVFYIYLFRYMKFSNN